ncbi:MAG: EamA family transporter [Burkholderiaceae bacterium]|nr:MAG: EamA family transporter [Burkholderiaceae bacterium]TBR76316.1 MAG: EamA family transporter [Burkholderiaceae bacterium]
MTQPRFSQRELLAALAVVTIWGLNFVAMKFALRDFTPFQLGAARFAAAVLPLAFFIRPPRMHWKWVVLFGLFQGLGQFGFLFMALKVGMTAALASVLAQTQLFFTAIFSFVLLRERPTRALQVGLLLAALGLVCFAMNYAAPRPGGAHATTALGFVLSLGAAAMWAGSNIVARKAQQATPQFDALAFVVWSSLVPILPFIALTLVFDDGATRWAHLARWQAVPAGTWLAIAYLGWAATILGYGLWTNLLKRHPANRVAPFGLGVPVVGLAAGMLVLGETVTTWQWAGIALVIAALACVLFGGPSLNKKRA